MRKELRRTLFAAAFAGAALAGCGGGNSTPSPTPSPSPSPSPAPPPASAGSYFLAARAGGSGTAASNNVPFSPTAVGASKFELAYVDAANPPLAFDLTNGTTNQLEAPSLGYDLGTFSEYFPASGGGTATSWGTRYQVYADIAPGGTGPGVLYALDLRKATAAAPTVTQISSGTVTSLALCSSPGASLFDNYHAGNLSWIVFHALGPDTNCGTLDDKFVAVQMSMSSSTAALSLVQGTGASQLWIEPVEALYDTSGTITHFLAIAHPPVCSAPPCTVGQPTIAVPLQQLDANFANPTTFATKLVGTGLNGAGGDFLSLGVSGNVWLYVDGSGIYSVNLTTGMTSTAIYTLMAGESVQGRAVFDGANAYVAIDSMAGSYVKMINTSTNLVTATQAADVASTQIALVGVTSNNLVYLSQSGSAIKSLAKSTLTGLTSLKTLTGTQTIDSLMGSNGASGPPIAFLVGDTVFFTVADTSATGATGFAKQAFFAAAGGAANSATPVAASVSAVLGVVAPATIPTSGPIAYTGALVMTGGGNTTPASGQAVQPVFASSSPAVSASLGLYGASGALTNTIGTLSSTNVAFQTSFASPVTGVGLNSGPVQAVMPATLLLFGSDGTGASAQDIAIFASNGSTPFAELSGFIQ